MELREIGRGPAHGVSRGLPSEGMSPEGEGLSVWRSGCLKEGGSQSLLGPTCFLSLSETTC